MPLFLEAAKPLHPLGRDDTEDIGQVARTKASGDRQLHRPVQFFFIPLLLKPVAGKRWEPLVCLAAATAFTAHDLAKNAASTCSQCVEFAE